jgi:dynamin GTPase/dynamin 1-like protein
VFEIVNFHLTSITSRRFDKLAIAFNSLTTELLMRQLDLLKKSILNYSEIQCSYINLNHPDFSKANALTRVLGDLVKRKKMAITKFDPWAALFGMQNNENKVNEQVFCDDDFEPDLIESLSNSYFNIVKKAFVDFSIKSSYHYSLFYLKNNLTVDLGEMSKNLDPSLLHESEETKNARKRIDHEIRTINSVLNLLNTK